MIRQIDRSELPVCADVVRRSFMTVADEFGFTPENAPRFTAFATTTERLEYQLDEQHRLMYVYCSDGNIVGYYSLIMSGDGECELGSLSVLPEFRHNGIGGELVRHAMDTARGEGCTLMKLSIVEENTVLRRWYESLGAVHTGTEKFDFFPFTCGYMEMAL
ncbi:MAG: GNAT family N-acetyltransferase [Ruminococcus sp.]|nr:GNAT family N-acetyltransferase [Ruminococcus sp.]